MIRKTLLAALAVFVLTLSAQGQTTNQLELPQASQRAAVEQRVGLTDIKINYFRPVMKGRKIFGEKIKPAASGTTASASSEQPLVPYGETWRTGANNATIISFTDDVKIAGQTLPAGRYSLHTIPTANEWTIIFNREAEQWGSFQYDAAKDALRVKAQPVRAGEMREVFTIDFPQASDSRATMELAWADVRVPLTIEVDTASKALKTAREAVAKTDAKDWRTPYQAANYAFQNNLAMPEAKQWLDRSLAAQETYGNLSLKARMLAREGNKAEAMKHAERAIQIGKAAKPQPADTGAMEKFLGDLKSGKQM